MIPLRKLLAFIGLLLASASANPRSAEGERYTYPVTLNFMLDETLQEGEPFLIGMEPERDTPEYRQRAFDWFSSQYDLDIPMNFQFGDLILGGKAVMLNWRLNPVYRMHVYGMDVQDEPLWRGKYPASNVRMQDDGYLMQTIAPLNVCGMFGMGWDPVNCYDVPVGSIILYGEYRPTTDDGEVLTTIQYESNCPVTSNTAPPFGTPINCELHSEEWGDGYNDGQNIVKPDSMYASYRITFPKHLADTDREARKFSRLVNPRPGN